MVLEKSYWCETQLLCFSNDLLSAIASGSFIDCVFIDFSKAFDAVCHKLLLLNLSKLGPDPHILKWIERFLYNRERFVTSNQCNSPPTPATSGLGSLTFSIYILMTCLLALPLPLGYLLMNV